MIREFPAHWLPVIQSAAGTIIGAGVIGMVFISVRLWWGADNSNDRWASFWFALGALALAAGTVWVALSHPK
jgi:hypothetical protein